MLWKQNIAFRFLVANDIGIGLEHLETMRSLSSKITTCEASSSCEDLTNYISFNILRRFKVFSYVIRIVKKVLELKSTAHIPVHCTHGS